ncbi:MAG: hypothetical protein ACLFSU_05845, partial [Acholeplasmataceae bacterium]
LKKYSDHPDESDKETLLDETEGIRTRIRDILVEVYEHYQPSLMGKGEKEFKIKVNDFLKIEGLDQVFTFYFTDQNQAIEFGLKLLKGSKYFVNYKTYAVDEDNYALQASGVVEFGYNKKDSLRDRLLKKEEEDAEDMEDYTI